MDSGAKKDARFGEEYFFKAGVRSLNCISLSTSFPVGLIKNKLLKKIRKKI